MKKLSIALLFLPLVSMAQSGDEAKIKQLSDEILRNGTAYDLLRQLTKDIGGRLAGSPQSAKAVQWGKLTMEQQGADKVYLQECMVPHWVRGGQDKATLVEINNKKANRKLDVLALGNSLGSGTVTGELLAVANFDELEKRKDEVKGKIVYYNNGFNPTNIKPFVSYGEAGIYRRWGASRAAKYGAVGVMIRSLTESTANDPHTGGMAYIDSFPKIPAIAVGPRDADAVWAMSKTGSMKLSMTTNGHFLPDTIGHNVIGELTGTEFPDQIITVGGHLDSWDVNEGAHDDGTIGQARGRCIDVGIPYLYTRRTRHGYRRHRVEHGELRRSDSPLTARADGHRPSGSHRRDDSGRGHGGNRRIARAPQHCSTGECPSLRVTKGGSE